MSQPDPFDFSEYNVEPVEEPVYRRPGSSNRALIIIGILILVVLVGLTGYLVVNDQWSKRDRARARDLPGELVGLRRQYAAKIEEAAGAELRQVDNEEAAWKKKLSNEYQGVRRGKWDKSIEERQKVDAQEDEITQAWRRGQEGFNKRRAVIRFRHQESPGAVAIAAEYAKQAAEFNAIVDRRPEFGLQRVSPEMHYEPPYEFVSSMFPE